MKHVEDVYALSPLQESMLMHCLLAPESTSSFTQDATTLHGALDLEAFGRTWQALAARHASLRTSFVVAGLKKPVQVVHRQVRVPIAVEDWRGVAPREQGEKLEAFLAADRERGFDLSRPPLLRLALLRVSEDAHVLVWSGHHLVVDGWCHHTLLAEALAIYAALVRTGLEPALPPAGQFREYVAWVRRQDLGPAAEFWRRQLAGFAEPASFCLDRLGAARASPSAGFVQRSVQTSARLSSALTGLVRQHRLTLAVLVHGAWGLLLSRYSGRRDVTIGTTVSGRPAELPSIESMVGIFINNLPLRIELRPGETVLAWLWRLQAQLGEMQRFDFCSALQIQQWSGLPAGQRLFESLVVFQNFPTAQAAADADAAVMEIGSSRGFFATGFPLTLAAEVLDGLRLTLCCEAGRLEEATLDRLAGHYQNLLEAIVASPNAAVDSLSALSAAELRQVLDSWSGGMPASAPAILEDGFGGTVFGGRDGAAVVGGGGEALGYRGLDQAAARLAARLRALGVGPEVAVGLLLDQGPDLAVGLLGVLAAGGACIVADPAWTAAALDALSGAAIVLARRGAAWEALAASACRSVLLDPSDPAGGSVDRAGAPAPGRALPAESLALIAPSGGVAAAGPALSRRALAGQVAALTEALGLTVRDDLVFAPRALGPAAGALLLLAALRAGTRVVYGGVEDASREAHGGAGTAGGQAILAGEGPAIARLWQDAVPAAAPAPRLLAGAGPLARGLAERWRRSGGETWSFHLAPDSAVLASVGPAEIAASGAVALRRPALGSCLHLLDADLLPVPDGVLGELFVGGDNLPRGWLAAPAATAARLLPDPFAADRPGARLYRTGELGRRLGGGGIELMGEAVPRLALRGRAVRTGEIEAALRRHPGVAAAAVVARREPSGDERLWTYVAAPWEKPSGAELRSFLQESLAEARVPASYVVAGDLDLTREGLIDLAALRGPLTASADAHGATAGPGTPQELALVRIWEDLFGLHPIGIDEDFFALGGHSVLAVHMIGRIRAQLGHDLPATILAGHRTIRQLGDALRRAIPLGDSPLVPIQRGGSRPPLFCVHPVGGGVFCYSDLAYCLGPEQPVHGLKAPGWQNEQQPLDSVEEMAGLYVPSLREAQASGPYRLLGWSFGGLVALEMAQRLRQGGEEVALLAILDTDIATPAPAVDDTERLLWFLGAMRGEFPLEVDGAALRRVGDLEAQIAQVVEEGQRQGLMPSGVDLDRMRRLFEVTRRGQHAGASYVPRPYGGRVTLFSTTSERPELADRTLGWGSLAQGGVDVHEVPGLHRDMVYRPWVEVLAERLTASLAAANSSDATAAEAERQAAAREQELQWVR